MQSHYRLKPHATPHKFLATTLQATSDRWVKQAGEYIDTMAKCNRHQKHKKRGPIFGVRQSWAVAVECWRFQVFWRSRAKDFSP